MKRMVLGKCPICNEKLRVVKLHCENCKTGIEGNFELDKFSYLTDEQKEFIEIFVKNRGNIKEIEKDLGISYPTVRRNLDQVIEALGYSVRSNEEEINKKEILEKLSKGEITSEVGMKLLEAIELGDKQKQTMGMKSLNKNLFRVGEDDE